MQVLDVQLHEALPLLHVDLIEISVRAWGAARRQEALLWPVAIGLRLGGRDCRADLGEIVGQLPGLGAEG